MQAKSKAVENKCEKCGKELTDEYVKELQERGEHLILCPACLAEDKIAGQG